MRCAFKFLTLFPQSLAERTNDYTYGIPTLWRIGKDTLNRGVSAVETHDGWMVDGWDLRKAGVPIR